MLGQQVLRAGIADILGIVNIADIADVADISTDIADIAMDIADIVNSADIADRILRTLRWKQVDAYKVLRGCPMTRSWCEVYILSLTPSKAGTFLLPLNIGGTASPLFREESIIIRNQDSDRLLSELFHIYFKIWYIFKEKKQRL